MQAGIYYGFVGQVDGIVTRMKEELGEPNVTVIATGGLAALISSGSHTIDIVDPMLTLKGLLHLYEKNKDEKKRILSSRQRALCIKEENFIKNLKSEGFRIIIMTTWPVSQTVKTLRSQRRDYGFESHTGHQCHCRGCEK